MEEKHYLEGIMRCTRCPDMCACCCPVFTRLKSQTVSPSNKAHTAQMLAAGLVDPTPETAEILFQCNNCRLCAEWCIYDDLVLGDLLSEARWRLYQQAPECLPDYVAELRKVYEEVGTLSTHPKAPDSRARKELRAFRSEQGAVLVYEGAFVRTNTPEITLAALQILKKLGIATIYLPEQEPPCGAEVELLGFRDLALRDARKTVEFLQSAGASRVVALDPLCAYQLEEGFPRLGIDFPADVLSLPAFLVEILENNHHTFCDLAGRELVLDDDPVLARYLHQADLSLQLLGAIPGCTVSLPRTAGVLAEPAVSYAPLPDPETEAAMTAKKVADLLETGADTIITTSPRAKVSISAIVQDPGRVMDLAELMFSALD